MSKKIHLCIILPSGQFYDDYIDYIVLKSTTGDIAFMPGHISMTCLLKEDIAKIVKDSKDYMFSIMGGFVRVFPDSITILTSAAEWPEDIDIDRAKYSKSRAESRLENIDIEDIDKDRAISSIVRAEIRLKLSLYKCK